jgi:predicted permease
MSAIRGLAHRFRVLVDPDGYAREVEREIRFHLDREAMQRRAAGLTETDADSVARRQFGNVTYVREEVRRMSGIEWLDRIRQNLAYAVRGLRQSPGFTAAVVLTLALGLGVNAAMFTFLDRVFVKPPAGVVNPREVRRMYAGLARKDEPNGRMFVQHLWYPQLREIKAADPSVVLGLFQSGADSVAVRLGASDFPALQGIANTDYFRVLGVRPQLGRFFDAGEDDIANPAPVAIISDAMWKRVFKGDPRVVGSTFRIKYRPITVIGVAPEAFTGIDLNRSDFWLPIGNSGSGTVPTGPWFDSYLGDFSVVTRFANAATEKRFLDVAARVVPPVKVAFFGDSTAEVLTGPIQSSLGPGKPGKEVAISMRLGGVGLIVLLITLANVSNLLLVRATRREREIAIRRALGVSRTRLLEQLVTETVLLAAVGGAVALLMAIWVGAALRGLLLPEVRWPTGVLDLRVIAFAGAAALMIGMLIGLVPAVHAWRPDLLSSLRAGGKGATYRRSRLRSGLLMAQAALSLTLLVGSGLFVQSLRNVQRIDLGFEYNRTMMVMPVADTGSLAKDLIRAMPDLLVRLAAIPGVESVAAASSGPMMGASYGGLILPGHDSLPRMFGQRGAARKTVTPGYFRTIGQRIIGGRELLQGDPPSVVVSQAMAKAFWPGESALGKCLIVDGKRNGPCLPVIGVTVETHGFSIIEDRGQAQYYTNGPETPWVMIRANPEARDRIQPLVSAEVRRFAPRALVVRVRPMEELFERELRPWRLGAKLFTAMGILALIVAAVGVYSVIAYATSQRTNEMGIRIALGARLADIARLVVGDGLRTVVIGIVLGIGLALAAGKLVASLLYGISPRDPLIIGVAAALLAVIGLAACVIPALRAARVDPVAALRTD